MYVNSDDKTKMISSIFTREKGFTKIDTNFRISRKKAINILNSLTPQGTSPENCIRIGIHDNLLGIGYYEMTNESTAQIRTYFLKLHEKELEFFNPFQLRTTQENKVFQIDKLDIDARLYDIIEKFGNEKFSAILYSILCGDNIIVIEKDHKKRLDFFSLFFEFIPSIVLKYNRLTSSCFELEGNENIIGVPELPIKFRSHEKMYLPLDTIFVDLENYTVVGNGIKNSPLTKIITSMHSNLIMMQEKLIDFYSEILHGEYSTDEIDQKTLSLIERIESKLGIRDIKMDNWIMDF